MRTDRLRPHRSPRGSRLAVCAALLATSALLLTGCQSTSAASHTSSATPESSRSASGSTPTPTPTAKPTPVKLTCDQVLTASQLSAMVPAITADPGFTPAKGSDAAKAVDDDGVACGFANASTGNTVAVSIARPASDDLTALKNTAITKSNVVPTYGTPPQVMGYFTATGGVGTAWAFTGDYWIAVVSKDYIEPGDASQVMAGVLANLPK